MNNPRPICPPHLVSSPRTGNSLTKSPQPVRSPHLVSSPRTGNSLTKSPQPIRSPHLICCPCAGGSSSFFVPLEEDLSALTLRGLPVPTLLKPDYPGHGRRRKEPFCKDFTALADDLFRFFRNTCTGSPCPPYALFGYSMGAIAVVELLRRILAAPDLPPPTRVFLAAHEPHSKAELAGYSPEEPDGRVKARTIRFGGIPEKLLNNQSFWRIYLPLYRADYALIDAYRFEDLTLQTDLPLTVFYSETDTPLREMQRWKKIFTGPCEFLEFPGSHFFIQDHHREMAKIIASRM